MAGSIEELVDKYHVFADAADSSRGEEIELEVRFEHVEFEFYGQLLNKLLGDATFSSTQSRTLQTIKEQGKDLKTRKSRIWERKFTSGDGRENDYHSKKPLYMSRVKSSPGSPGYKVAVSEEKPCDPFVVVGVLYRVENRVSFEVGDRPDHPLYGWRVDITITYHLSDAKEAALREIVGRMFALDDFGSQTPATLTRQLGLSDPAIPTTTCLANRSQYKYNVEIEYIGPPADLNSAKIQAAVNSILQMTNPGYLTSSQAQSELRDVAAYLKGESGSPAYLQRFATGEWGLKQLTPQAIAPTRGQYAEIYPPIGYHLTDKAHGIHALCIVREGRLVVIAPGLEQVVGAPMVEVYVPGKGRPTIESAVATGELPAASLKLVQDLTIVDGELLVDDSPAEASPLGRYRFLAFDVIASGGEIVADRTFEQRVGLVPHAASVVAQFGVRSEPKPFVHLTSSDAEILTAQFEAMLNRPDRDYEIDGLILYTPGKNYMNTQVLKWKPFEENTNDFLVRRPPASVRGRYPFLDRPGHKLYFLYVGVSKEMFDNFALTYGPGYQELFPAHSGRGSRRPGFFPVPFQPSDQPYAFLYQHPDDSPVSGADIENRISEFRLASVKGADGTAPPIGTPPRRDPAPDWVIVRIRTDRDEDLKRGRLFGNSYYSAERNWLNYRDPFLFEMLGGGPGSEYFSGAKSGIYTAPTNFISFAKTSAVEANLAGMNYIVDLGAGKGQDLNRYRKFMVRHVLMVDSSQSALAELVRRKHGTGRKRRVAGKTHVSAKLADFTDPYQEVAAELRAMPDFPSEGANGVVCNLAAHYAFGSEASMINFIMLIKSLVRPGGIVQITLLDGQQVYDLLKASGIKKGQSWDAREDGVLKYSIRRMYADSRMTGTGQKIGVLLPFSRGELYEEYLSNIEHLTKNFRNRGFRRIAYDRLWEKHEQAFRNQKVNYNALTGDDKTWLGLFSVVRFEHNK